MLRVILALGASLGLLALGAGAGFVGGPFGHFGFLRRDPALVEDMGTDLVKLVEDTLSFSQGRRTRGERRDGQR